MEKNIINKYPIFVRGNILDAEVLELMLELPYFHATDRYSAFTDGIINGINFYKKDNKIYITKGTAKYNNYLYILNEDTPLDIPESDGDYLIKLKFLKPIEERKSIAYNFSLLISEKELESDEIILAKIKRREGASLRIAANFLGIDKEYNLINEIEKPQSSLTNKNIPLSILKLYAKDLLDSKELLKEDTNFVFHILNAETQGISRELLNGYIYLKTGEDVKEKNQLEIYKDLIKIYINLEGKLMERKQKFNMKRKMIVE